MKTTQTTPSVQSQRQRKMHLLLPLVVFPFLTLMLWSVGVIGSTGTPRPAMGQRGFNTNLPPAVPGKDSNWNKLKFYEAADRDSAKYRSLLKNDPNYQGSDQAELGTIDTGFIIAPGQAAGRQVPASYDPYPHDLTQPRDPNEEKVYRKLAALQQELDKSSHPAKPQEEVETNGQHNPPFVNTGEIDRLESMMQQMQGTEGGDPEMIRINGMLEKILDIQHPERINEQLKAQSQAHRTQVLPVRINDHPDNISLLEKKQRPPFLVADTNQYLAATGSSNGFYSLEDAPTEAPPLSIRAVVDETKEVVSGAKVKLRLLQDVYIQGIRVPAHTFVYGKGQLNDGRLMIEIKTIQFRDKILPVSLTVYDLDGMAGLDMNTNMAGEVTRQATDQAMQGLSLATLDPSLGAQAASAGIQAAKTLIGKKTKLIKVTVKAGHDVLLRDNNQDK